MPRPLLIIQTGTTLPKLRQRFGDFPHWFRLALKVPNDEIRICRVDIGESLPIPSAVRGAIITGSASMVSERQHWSEQTAGWIRAAMDEALPLFGVCYGHQLLAHALGGRVDYNPHGREIGTVRITSCAASAHDVLFAPLIHGFNAHATHQQTVVEAPIGATLLARSDLDQHQALRFGACAWGVQFHPEFSTAAMRGYIEGRRAELETEGQDTSALLREIVACSQSRQLLARFARYTTMESALRRNCEA